MKWSEAIEAQGPDPTVKTSDVLNALRELSARAEVLAEAIYKDAGAAVELVAVIKEVDTIRNLTGLACSACSVLALTQLVKQGPRGKL